MSSTFVLTGNHSEIPAVANATVVTPTVSPLAGELAVLGSGGISFGAHGIAFHRTGHQATDSAFLAFRGSKVGDIFNGASQIDFDLKSIHSAEARFQQGQEGSMRIAFEVWDDSRRMFQFATYAGPATTTREQQLVFNFGALGWGNYYTVPAGTEETVFGKGVSAKIRIAWAPDGTVQLYVNDELVQTNKVRPLVPVWGDKSLFLIGAGQAVQHSVGHPGYCASEDVIGNLTVS